MAAVALTYQSGPRARDLRTVICEDVRTSVMLLPTGSLDVITAKLLHGTACRCAFWAAELGTDPASDDFVIPASAVRQQRTMQIAVRSHHKKGN
jgi:hypothetical protein